MKDKSKITVGYQYRHMLLNHLAAVFIAAVLQLLAFSFMFEKTLMKIIAGIVFSLVYFSMMYSASGNAAAHDNKSYTPLKPDYRKGVLFGVMIACITLILFICYKLVWANFSSDGVLQSWHAIALNAVFLFWNFPFFGFLGDAGGEVPWYGLTIMLITPIAATTLGYIASCKKFYISDKLLSFVYVKKDSKK